MKIGILTWYKVINHGAILQAYAMKKVLEGKGHEVFFIDYIRNRNGTNLSKKRILSQLKRMTIRRWLGRLFLNKKKKIFMDFRNEHFQVLSSADSIDLICVGSDEIFDVSSGYTPLIFGNDSTIKTCFAYAPSFGKTTYETLLELNLVKEIANGLRNFSAISARDGNTFGIINKCLGIQPRIVLDPTILYGFKQTTVQDTRIIDKIKDLGKYIVLYSYQENFNERNDITIVRAIAKKNNLPIIALGYFHPWCDESINATPFEFVEIMRNAEYVVTDTYHGTAFSILFNKTFCTKYRWYNHPKLSYLLEMFGLQSQLISNAGDIERVLNNIIDYGTVNKKIEQFRNESNQYIKSVLLRH